MNNILQGPQIINVYTNANELRACIAIEKPDARSRTGDNYLRELDIPLDSLKGFHIHTGRHKWPTLNDPIPWKYVFGRIREIEHDLIINPERHQQNKVKQTIKFCEALLNEDN